MQTLERHVASLQQRLREAEDEHARIAELVEAEREATHEREHELRRVKQREYAEQQLRVEAEERLSSIDRESRLEIEELSVRLSASEQDARALTRRLEGVQRQLAEAEQAAAAELAAVRSDLQSVDARACSRDWPSSSAAPWRSRRARGRARRARAVRAAAAETCARATGRWKRCSAR